MTPAVEAQVKETGESIFAVNILVSGHALKGDEPETAGGKNLGPAPYDYLTTALGECTAMTVRWYAQQQKWPLEKVSVHVRHHKEDRRDFFKKIIALTGDQLTAEQRAKLIEVASKCPVQRTLENAPVIATQVAEGAS